MMFYRKFLIWLTNTQIYSDFLLKVIPYIRFSLYYTSLRGNQYNEAYNIIKAGDFIVCRDSKKLTTILIGGEWTHAALFLGKISDDEEYECAEMSHTSFTKSDFFDVAKESTDFAIFRCLDYDEVYIKEIVKKCKSFEGTPYDVGFDLGIKALYCSELVYQSDFEKRLKVNLDDIRGLGRKYISPSGLAKALNVECIYESKQTKPRR